MRSPGARDMLTGQRKPDGNFIKGLSRHMSKRRVSFSGGLVMTAEAQVGKLPQLLFSPRVLLAPLLAVKSSRGKWR